MSTGEKRVLSGMRPTGRLHIGHYFGALQNWVRLQNAVLPAGGTGEEKNVPSGIGSQAGAQHAAPLQKQTQEYECFYFIADWHALTSDYADTSGIAENVIQITTDYLAAGLDPNKSVIFQQSLVPEHAELHLLLSMVTPLGWLERVPTYKEALENIKDKDLHTYGFLGYPTLQTADIVMYSEPGKPLIVPVGEDQVSHVELSREIVRRFNLFYGLSFDESLREESRAWLYGELAAALRLEPLVAEGTKAFPLDDELWVRVKRKLHARIMEIGVENAREAMRRINLARASHVIAFNQVLTEPDVMLTKTPRIPGLDGRKMSKSYGNAITLSESDAEIYAKTKVMVTDPARKRRTDPGNPDVCPVYDWHKLFSSPETLKWAAEGCRTAGIGCIECKAKMADHLIEWLNREGIRDRRLYYEKRRKEVRDIVREGSVRARLVAQETMKRVRDAVFGEDRIKRRTIRRAPK